MKKTETHYLINIYNRLLLAVEKEDEIFTICQHIFYLSKKLQEVNYE